VALRLLPVPAADIAAVEPDHDGAGRLRHSLLCSPGGLRRLWLRLLAG
jgi:hypothetical protein